MTAPARTVSNLDYFYPAKQALHSISFTIPSGEITALVGPNGAGKTTLMRCLAGLDAPFSGKIEICGIDILERPREGHAKLGYLSDDFGLYDDLSVRDVLGFIAGCHGLDDTPCINSVIERLRLGSVADQKCGALSRGWRQRVGIGMAIIHHPSLLILDEPASGLDPEARSELSTILKGLQAEGMSILVSSHILSELEEYSTAMLVLRDGKIRKHITLASHQAESHIKILIRTSESIRDEQEALLLHHSMSEEIVMTPDRKMVQITTSSDPKQHHAILKTLIAQDIPVCAFSIEETSLQNLYLDLAK